MAIYLVRAGKQGQFEQQFLDNSKAFLTFGQTEKSWKEMEWEEIRQAISKEDWVNTKGQVSNFSGQINAFAKTIQVGDWIVLPSKFAPTIHFGKVTSAYRFAPREECPHLMDVDWCDIDIPRDRFDQDILYSLGAFMTVCQIQRNNAEVRIEQMRANGWKVADRGGTIEIEAEESEELQSYNLEEYARDQISKQLIRQYKGHGMERLVGEILKAMGYEVYESPKGADNGVDLLAASGQFGFGDQRILVQVKTQDTPVGQDVVDRLVGTMHAHHADKAILVSWSGIKRNVESLKKSKFFEVRFWDRDNIIHELLENYEKLSDEFRAELPLKRIWTLTDQD